MVRTAAPVGARVALGAGAALVAALAGATAAARIGGNADHSPVDPAGHGLRLVWTVSVLAALALYLLALPLLRRRLVSFRAALAIGAVVQLVPLAAPLLLSHDAFTYWDYGRLAAVHHVNPYATPPSAFPGDPAYAPSGATWHHVTTIYGPVFTLLSEAHAYVVGGSQAAAELVYRVVAALAIVAAAALAARVSTRPAFAVAVLSWNPLLALHFAGGGHNDALMVALIVAGLALAAGEHEVLGGVAWASAAGIKWMPLLFLPLLLAAGRSRRFLAGFAAGVVTIAAVSTAAFGTRWLRVTAGLSHQARRQGGLGPAGWLGHAGLPHRAVLAVLALGFAAVYGTALVDAWRRRRGHLAAVAASAALAQASLNPWYASWGLGFAAVEESVLGQALAVATSVYLAFDALPL